MLKPLAGRRTLESQLPLPRTAMERQVSALDPWFHNLHLPDGTQTAPNHPLGDFPAFKWNEIAACLPERMENWEVLDVGCNAGFYTFELARRGARVTGIDLDPHYLRQAEWAGGQFGLRDRVQFRQMQVYELARLQRQYDLIWFMGVFYHLRYPMLALDILAMRARRYLMFQSLSLPEDPRASAAAAPAPPDLEFNQREQLLTPGWPRMAFVEHSLAGDPTNWWIANASCIEAILRAAGFRVLERPAHETYFCEFDPGLRAANKGWNENELHAALGI